MRVSRMFTSSDDATAAVDDLVTYGLRQDFIHVITGSVNEADLHAHGIVADHSKAYETALAAGGALVVVDAPLGTAKPVGIILERPRPGDTAAVSAYSETTATLSREMPQGDEAAPLSSWLGWKVLLHDPAPLSNWLKWPILSANQTPSVTLSDNPAPLSSKIGLKILSDDPAPFSTAVKQPVLVDDAAPLSRKVKMQVLLDEPAPLSKWLNWPALSAKQNPATGLLDDPAPLSRMLNWPVLTKKQ